MGHIKRPYTPPPGMTWGCEGKLCTLIRKERLATRRRVPPGPRGAAGQTVQRPAVLDPSQGRGMLFLDQV